MNYRSRTRPSSRINPAIDPLTRVSPHFLLADFLGNQSVYTRGYVNSLIRDTASLKKMDNLGALCHHGLEPILAKWGPLSVSYGYISPEVSQQIVSYMDPTKPSHHRFDLGAAADICVHRWVQDEFVTLEDLFLPESARSAPIALAHGIDQADIPYSRLITYSESPFICLAIAADEVGRRTPRKAFYENRYGGFKGRKADYRQYSTPQARDRAFQLLQEDGLNFPWRGHGYPTYHGGGRRQYQHMRVSRYTMVSDFVLNLQSIANGYKNIPDLNLDTVQDAFAAAGTVYDTIIENMGLLRMSIVGGYVSPLNPEFDEGNDWRGSLISFDVVPPAHIEFKSFVADVNGALPSGVVAVDQGTTVRLTISVDEVLNEPEWT